MKHRLAAALLALSAFALPLCAQQNQLPLPPALEKELAARASDVTEVSLNRNTLAFAAKVMNGKNDDDAAVRQLIQGLDGIYVRSYEFDKDGQYSLEQIDQLRKAFETPEWSPIIRTNERRSGEMTDIMVKLVNGESHGIFILTAEPRELTLVLILGPIRMEDLGKLHGLSGLGALSDVPGVSSHGKGRKGDKGEK
ncbi:MAG TPA: DUF4252 domain-containing protein [Terracidiphilus sp.]|nr:DUF4252 domain-containing protein [Terracidiphilus sp.]